MKKFFIAIFLGVFLIFITAHCEKKIYVLAEVGGVKKIITAINAKKNLPLEIKFIHSVQKTPVIEILNFDGENFILQRTIYKSHGVGLPFLESDGNFHFEDGNFILEMHREIKNLELRTGLGTQLTITLNGKIFELYKNFPSGTKIIFQKQL